jgi:rubrerythrin
MTETVSIEIELPDFMRLVEAEARKEILKEVEEKIKPQIVELFENTARKLVAQKMNFISPRPAEKPEKVEPVEETIEVKTALAEEILSMSEKDALTTLKMSLATGKIDEATYRELKELVKPAAPTFPAPPVPAVCPTCGKELEPAAHFCRFCGTRIT